MYLQSHNPETSYTYRYLSIICGWVIILFTDSACCGCRAAQVSFLCVAMELDLCSAGLAGVVIHDTASGDGVCHLKVVARDHGSAAAFADTCVHGMPHSVSLQACETLHFTAQC